MPKVNKTMCLSQEAIDKGEKKSKKLKISFSAYVQSLILETK